MDIRKDDLRGPEVAELLQEHLRDMHRVTPAESIHALDLDGLRQPDITFWTIWDEGILVGSGALKELDPQHAEIKSMRTASTHRRKGVARQMLQHLLNEAKRRAYTRVSLETGSLYASFGFAYCQPFADYSDDPNSVFMTKEL
jgi:putative acetyltransferase